jgi:hypothetical protein
MMSPLRDSLTQPILYVIQLRIDSVFLIMNLVGRELCGRRC